MSLAEYKHYRDLEKRVEARRKALWSIQPVARIGIVKIPIGNPIEMAKFVENKLRKEFPEWYEDSSEAVSKGKPAYPADDPHPGEAALGSDHG